MVSRASPVAQANAARRRRVWGGLAKTALGLLLLAALLFWGQIDLRALSQLVDHPFVIVGCLTLLLLALPIAAIRWRILLRALEVSIPFVNLLHFVAIGILSNMFLLGNLGGDAIRGLYAWRSVGRTGDRIAVSILADRVSAMFALLFLCLIFSVFNWRRMQQVPALSALGVSAVIAVAACIVAIGILFAFPRLIGALERLLSRWPRARSLVSRGGEIVIILRTNVPALLAALVLAVTIQILVIISVAILANALKIGTLGVTDMMLAVPLTLAVNALPLTPNGIGVGEAAFDQICHWLEPTPTNAPYSSIFFAFRVIYTLTGLPGLFSLVIYRNSARSEPG